MVEHIRNEPDKPKTCPVIFRPPHMNNVEVLLCVFHEKVFCLARIIKLPVKLLPDRVLQNGKLLNKAGPERYKNDC